MLQRDVDGAGRLVVDTESGRDRAALVDLGRDRGDVELLEDRLHELLVALGDHRREVVGRWLLASGAHIVGGHNEVDAVRLAVAVVVDPVELDLEFVGCERKRAEYAEPTGPADRGNDIATMREREDRKLDTELVADR